MQCPEDFLDAIEILRNDPAFRASQALSTLHENESTFFNQTQPTELTPTALLQRSRYHVRVFPLNTNTHNTEEQHAPNRTCCTIS